MNTSANSDRRIISAALAASTYEEAVAVADLIAADVGQRHERPVGDKFNNYGLMASSGSYEYKALEPVTNEQDSVIERLAAAKWGNLAAVPYQTPAEAAKDLVGAMNYQQQADLATVSFRESDNPTRSSKRLTIVYRDYGCGMEASQVPQTIFALGSSHKVATVWQQGAYGIGGASTYRNARAVVLATRRAPEMAPATDRIAVAVVLWSAHGKAQTASYHVTTNWPVDTEAEPWSAPGSSFSDFDPGTHLALISYGVEGFHRARSGDERSFDMVLNTRLLAPIMPVRFTNDITRSKNEYLRGLGRRLADNPSSDRLSDEEELLYTSAGVSYRLPVRYYVFPTGDTGTRRRFVAKDHALVFTSNGQVHHHWTPADFRLRTNLNKLYDRILVVVETDALPIELRTALFTPDRSQLLANEPALQLEDQVADFLDHWSSLTEANNQLIRDAIASASSGGSAIDVGRRIASALKVRGFNLSGQGTTGGGRTAGGPGGPRRRKTVDTYPDPTTLEGPDRLVIEDGKLRYVEYMLNAVDDFLDSGRGALTFATDHPDIRPAQHIVVGRLRDGYVRVQLQVPEGAVEGDFQLTAELSNWHRAAGGTGPTMTYSTALKVVDEIIAATTGGSQNGTKGAGDGGLVAVIWQTPEEYGNDWNNATPGSVEDIDAEILSTRDDYKDLAKLAGQKIPTIVLNQDYAQYKGYIAARARTLTEAGTREASDRYAVGVGFGLLLLHEDVKKRENSTHVAVDAAQVLTAKQAVARSVLLMMPAFDTLAREAGVET